MDLLMASWAMVETRPGVYFLFDDLLMMCYFDVAARA